MSASSREYAVCVGNPGGDDFNTIVVGGFELVVPLELDLDGDPLQDDEVRLRSEDGGFERVVKASDPEAVPAIDERLLYYHFRDVPLGAYCVEVNVGGRWSRVLDGIVVQRSGPVLRGATLGTDRPALRLSPGLEPDEEPHHEPHDEPDDPAMLEYMDLAEGFGDR